MTNKPGTAREEAIDAIMRKAHLSANITGDEVYTIGQVRSMLRLALSRTSPERPAAELERVFTEEQVRHLNEFQQGPLHPFTCGNNHKGDRVLFATVRGWICPCCDYTQDWAHSFMADGSALKAAREQLAALTSDEGDHKP